MKRKGLIILLSALLCLSATLSGCGGDDSDDSSSKAKEPTASVTESSEDVSEEKKENSIEVSESEDFTDAGISVESIEDSVAEESEEESSDVATESSTEVVESSAEIIESNEETVESNTEAIESSEEIAETPTESSAEVSNSTDESSEEAPMEDIEFSVSVMNPDGSPCTSGVVVKFMQNGEQVAMQVPNSNGVAAKTLPAGTYTIELAFTGTEFFNDAASISLDATSASATVTLCNSLNGEANILYVGGEEFPAYDVVTGATFINLSAGMNYFVFTPTVAGMYEFKPSDANAVIGYHGAPHFVQSNNVGDVINNVLSISVSASGISTSGAGTTQLVIGIEALNGISECVLSITRTGDAEVSLSDLPWTIYEKTASLENYTLPAGTNLVNFDLTADSYNLVYNEADGFYHLNSADGPLVMVWLTKEPAYMVCFKTMLDRSGVNKYFFDDDGNFVKKEDYSGCLLEYIEYADETNGVYPLTKDLEYIIKQRGDYVGWWDSSSPGYIFRDRNGNPDTNINPDVAWLFMCCYAG